MRFLIGWGDGEPEIVEAGSKWDALKNVADATLSSAANKVFNWVLIATSDFKECIESFNVISQNGEIENLYQLGETLYERHGEDE